MRSAPSATLGCVRKSRRRCRRRSRRARQRSPASSPSTPTPPQPTASDTIPVWLRSEWDDGTTAKQFEELAKSLGSDSPDRPRTSAESSGTSFRGRLAKPDRDAADLGPAGHSRRTTRASRPGARWSPDLRARRPRSATTSATSCPRRASSSVVGLRRLAPRCATASRTVRSRRPRDCSASSMSPTTPGGPR